MLILQIKRTLAAFVHQGIHRGLPSPQHVSPSSACLSQPLGFPKGLLRPKLTWGLQQQSMGLSAKCLGQLGTFSSGSPEKLRDKWHSPPNTHTEGGHPLKGPLGAGDLHLGCRLPSLNTHSIASQDETQDLEKGIKQSHLYDGRTKDRKHDASQDA